MNKKNKSDVFLKAITGTIPIEKSNRNYKPFIKNKSNKKKQNKKNSETILHIPKKKKKYQEEEIHKRFKIDHQQCFF